MLTANTSLKMSDSDYCDVGTEYVVDSDASVEYYDYEDCDIANRFKQRPAVDDADNNSVSSTMSREQNIKLINAVFFYICFIPLNKLQEC